MVAIELRIIFTAHACTYVSNNQKNKYMHFAFFGLRKNENLAENQNQLYFRLSFINRICSSINRDKFRANLDQNNLFTH